AQALLPEPSAPLRDSPHDTAQAPATPSRTYHPACERPACATHRPRIRSAPAQAAADHVLAGPPASPRSAGTAPAPCGHCPGPHDTNPAQTAPAQAPGGTRDSPEAAAGSAALPPSAPS